MNMVSKRSYITYNTGDIRYRRVRKNPEKGDLEIYIDTLPSSAKDIDRNVVQFIQDIYPIFRDTSEIYHGHIDDCGFLLKSTITEDNIAEPCSLIVIDTPIAKMQGLNDDYLRLMDQNPTMIIKPVDLLRKLLYHERAHVIFDEMYQDQIVDLAHLLVFEDNIDLLEPVDEAFAFWFEDTLTGIKSLNENKTSEYIYKLDAKLMRFMYNRFMDISDKKGFYYVRDNLKRIIYGSISEVIDIEKWSILQ